MKESQPEDEHHLPDCGEHLAQSSRTALGPPSLLDNEYRESFQRGKARPGRDADLSSPSSADVRNE
jgi:hypothetical protein